MAKMKGGVFSQTRGSIGGVTASTWKGINYLKSKPIPTDPQTANQIFQRQKMATARNVLAKAKKCGLWDIIKPAFNSEMPEQDFIKKFVKYFLSKTLQYILYYPLDNYNNEIAECEGKVYVSYPPEWGARSFTKDFTIDEQGELQEYYIGMDYNYDDVELLKPISQYNPNTHRVVVWQFTPYGEAYNQLTIQPAWNGSRRFNHPTVVNPQNNFQGQVNIPFCIVFSANFKDPSKYSTFVSMQWWNFNCEDNYRLQSIKKRSDVIPVVGQKQFFSMTNDHPKSMYIEWTHVGTM